LVGQRIPVPPKAEHTNSHLPATPDGWHIGSGIGLDQLSASLGKALLLITGEEAFEEARTRRQPVHSHIIRCMVVSDWVYFN
ncbi:MAG: hypothetical protein ACRD1Q_03920, partial [Vicinamibacterales bacterium]